MSSFIDTQINTSSGLRDKLFTTLDKLIRGEIELDYVEGVVAISDQIITSARLDFEVAIKHEEYRAKKDERIAHLSEKIDSITFLEEELDV